MGRKLELVGTVVGQWEVLEDMGIQSVNSSSRVYRARCIYCGFIRDRIKKVEMLKHIDCDRHQKTKWASKKIRFTFDNMKARCYNPNSDNYARYGGRGIRICDEWLKCPQNFNTWAVEHHLVGDLTIDRIDNNGNYSPENCRVVTQALNNLNRPFKPRLYMYKGKYYTLDDLSEKLVGDRTKLATYRESHSALELKDLLMRFEKEGMVDIPNNRERWISVGNETKSISAWERELGLAKTRYLSHYAKKHTDEEVAQHIFDLRTNAVAIKEKTPMFEFNIHGKILTCSQIIRITNHFKYARSIPRRVARNGFEATEKYLNALIPPEAVADLP